MAVAAATVVVVPPELRFPEITGGIILLDARPHATGCVGCVSLNGGKSDNESTVVAGVVDADAVVDADVDVLVGVGVAVMGVDATSDAYDNGADVVVVVAGVSNDDNAVDEDE
jgi:hypothetical protein